MAGADLSAGNTPACQIKDKLVAGHTLDDSIPDVISLAHPCGSHIIAEQHQSIKLVLVEGQSILVRKAVDAGFEGDQVFLQQHFSLFPGDTVGIIIRITAGAVTDGILAVIPLGVSQEPFPGF